MDFITATTSDPTAITGIFFAIHNNYQVKLAQSKLQSQ
jgi:hypothetical protein